MPVQPEVSKARANLSEASIPQPERVVEREQIFGRKQFLFPVLVGALLFCAFMALGTWQLQRREWKLDLIDRVEQRVHATPIEAPSPDRWNAVTATADEYRHIQLTGRFLPEKSAWVQASTELGPGYWLMTPLRSTDGSLVLINRGFVPNKQARSTPNEIVTLTGLLRLTEPVGGFLRRNDAASERWYSRDVQAIATARSLGPIAPYFIDADASPSGQNADEPVAGLTVIAFHNNHLAYALTWYALAALVLFGAWQVMRSERNPKSRD